MQASSPQSELKRLRRAKTAFDAQNRLLENLVAMARSSSKSEMMKTTMQKTLDVACELSGAEKGSLFLLNEAGVVTDSILTRGEVPSEKRLRLIGTVLDRGLAGWVRENLDIGLVEDTQMDHRWLSLPDEPYTVRSALAVPIIRHKWLFGILTLMHSHPRYFSEGVIDMVQMTADQMALAIENAKLYAKLEASYRSLETAKQDIETYSRALDRELQKGRKIQQDFLPRHIPEVANCEIVSYFHPALQLSGDFYDVFVLGENLLGLAIGDVSDKGVGSALFMALLRSLLRVFSCNAQLSGALQKDGQDSVLNVSAHASVKASSALMAVSMANQYFADQHGEEGMFATLFFGIIDPLKGKMHYINAGHEALLMINTKGIKNRLKPTGPAVGLMPEAIFKINEIQFETGDILLGFTDGVSEARSPQGQLYTRKRVEESAVACSASTAEALTTAIKSNLFNFIENAPQTDDITMLTIRWG